MKEIWIPELLITLFLFLPVIRPFIKKLKPMEGLAWLPLLALLIILVLIPAYGFRPETIPLFIYAAVLTVSSILQALMGSRKYKNSRHLIFAFPALVSLVLAAGIAFFFTPPKDTALSTQGVYDLRVKAGIAGLTADRAGGITAGEKEYSIRIYTDENDKQPSLRPLLVILPPGSLAMTDQICGELRNSGFTVLSFVRLGMNPAEQFRRMHAFFSGTVSSKANARGRALEDARKDDLLFLLSWLRQNPQVDERTQLFTLASPDAVFFAGYDAGGSALVLLSNSLSFGGMTGTPFPGRAVSSDIKIRGLIAIESSLWSVYQEEIFHIPDLPPDSGWFESVRYGLSRWFWEMKSKKITALGQIPELSTPLLFLVSDRSRKSESGRSPHGLSGYRALFEAFQAARGPAVLVSVDGAGPLAYSDFPIRYPLINVFFPGHTKTGRDDLEILELSAGIITKFAAGILETSPLRSPSLLTGVQVVSKNSIQW